MLLAAWFEDKYSPKEIYTMLQDHIPDKNLDGQPFICDDKDVAAVVKWLGVP